MFVGVVSDTHCEDNGAELPQAVLDALAGSELIVHCGDIVAAKTLTRLSTVAPVFAVRSPVDPPVDGDRLRDPPQLLERHGFRIGVLSRPADLPGHADLALGPRTDAATLAKRALAIFGGPVDAVLYRGSHRAEVHQIDGIVLADPGSPTRWAGPRACVGRLHLEPGDLRYEVVDVTAALPLRHRLAWRWNGLVFPLVNLAYTIAETVSERVRRLRR